MAEADGIKHILNGIDEDAFQMLISKILNTGTQVTDLSHSYNERRRQCLFTRRPVPHQESLSCSTPSQDPVLHSQIKSFVCEVAR